MPSSTFSAARPSVTFPHTLSSHCRMLSSCYASSFAVLSPHTTARPLGGGGWRARRRRNAAEGLKPRRTYRISLPGGAFPPIISPALPRGGPNPLPVYCRRSARSPSTPTTSAPSLLWPSSSSFRPMSRCRATLFYLPVCLLRQRPSLWGLRSTSGLQIDWTPYRARPLFRRQSLLFLRLCRLALRHRLLPPRWCRLLRNRRTCLLPYLLPPQGLFRVVCCGCRHLRRSYRL